MRCGALTELCGEIRNWFEVRRSIRRFEIENGQIDIPDIQPGEYYRIVGSVFNDGVYQHPTYDLHDESFDGAVWLMAVPPEVLDLASDIKDWRDKYETTDSTLLSPYQSESFGGYAYSKSGGGAGSGLDLSGTWQGAFAARLRRGRKI